MNAALVLPFCLLVAAFGPCRASAQAPARAHGPARVTPIGPNAGSTAVTSALTVVSGLALYFMPAQPTAPESHWRGGMLMDEGFRDAFRLHTVADQQIAATISDITLTLTLMNAGVIDAALVPLLQGDPDLAWQATFAHGLVLGLMLTVGEVTKNAVGRARPYERDCAADPQRHGCDGEDRFASFYSLHSGMAFASAGFTCAMHLSRSLYDDEAADGAACATSLAFAAATGLLRVVADRHYLTDVLIGAGLGLLIGYLVPLAIVPERRAAPLADPDVDVAGQDGEPVPGELGGFVAVVPMVSPGSTGFAQMGTGSTTIGVSAMGAF